MDFLATTPFVGMPTLETERLVIRRMGMRDAEDLYEYGKDPEVARHVLWDAYRNVSEARGYVRYVLRKYRAGEPASWCIELKSEQKVIGTIGFMWYQRDNNAAEVGYSLSRAYWNKGIMTEALAEIIRYGFCEARLHRIEAQHEVSNPASGAVMRKCGMRMEGTLRGRLYNKGRYVDVNLYSILREEYFSREKSF